MIFADVTHTKDSDDVDYMSKRRHVPVLEVLRDHGGTGQDYIHVRVGKCRHPNNPEHHIEYIELYGRTKMLDILYLGKARFGVGVEPDAMFCLVNFGKFREFFAVAYCNVHGPWEGCIKIRQQLRLTAGCRREKCLQEGFGV